MWGSIEGGCLGAHEILQVDKQNETYSGINVRPARESCESQVMMR